MRAKFSLILAVLLLVCCLLGCTASAPAVSAARPVAAGDQSAFLQDMATGIAARLTISDSYTPDMTDEAFVVFYTRLISCELDEIGKYTDVRFADARFDELSHAYLDLCRLQITALNYYNEALYSALWDSGRSARGAIILYLYEQYDLPISAEQAALYRPGD